MPDGIAPFMNPFDDRRDPVDELESVAQAVFAAEYHCLVNEVDALLDDNPALQAEFDRIMDFVARDTLTDDCNLAVADATFIHLSDIGLVNAVPVKVAPGVAIPKYSPRQLALAKGR